MSLSDCIKCWNTPCECGWEYRNWSSKSRIDLASVILGCDAKVLETTMSGKIPLKHPQNEKTPIVQWR